MQLFSRRKPTPAQRGGAASDAADAFSVPEPMFGPVPEADIRTPDDGPVDGSPTEPRDPNAPPIPGAPATAAPAPQQPDPGPARDAEEAEADTARFRRPGSRGNRKPRKGAPRKPTSRRRRGTAERTATPHTATTDAPVTDGPAGEVDASRTRTPDRGPAGAAAWSRGVVASFSPAALLAAVVAVTLFTVLLALMNRPGEGTWVTVAALVLVGVVQLVLFVGAVIVVRRKVRRRLGVTALVLLLLVNPVSASAVDGLLPAPSGGPGSASGSGEEEHDPIWDTYPGSAYVDAKETLDGPGYEDFVEESDTMLAEIRTALTAEFGFEWAEREPAATEQDNNGYGGESMLFDYTAPVWQTTTTVRTFEEKSRVVELIRQVLLRHGIANLDMQNAPSSWREPGELTERYGGETIDAQALWDLHTYDAITGSGSFSASIVDLTLDSAGTVTKDRQFDVDYHGLAAEGIELHLESYALLKESDRADYLQALKPYEGLDKPE